jgi:hypothetical protein
MNPRGSTSGCKRRGIAAARIRTSLYGVAAPQQFAPGSTHEVSRRESLRLQQLAMYDEGRLRRFRVLRQLRTPSMSRKITFINVFVSSRTFAQE